MGNIVNCKFKFSEYEHHTSKALGYLKEVDVEIINIHKTFLTESLIVKCRMDKKIITSTVVSLNKICDYPVKFSQKRNILRKWLSFVAGCEKFF